MLFLTLVTGLDWNEVAVILGNRSRTSNRWETEFDKVVAGSVRDELRSHSVVFVPMSGADVASAMAVQPWASRYILADRSPPGSVVKNLAWLERAARQAERILATSHAGGYQYGHLVRAFAQSFGMMTLLLAALGAQGVFVEDVQGTSIIARRGHRFRVDYVMADLHGNVAAVDRAVPDAVITLLKGTEQGFHLEAHSRRDFRGARNVDALLERQARRNVAVDRLADLVLNHSAVVVQDVTGVAFRKLEAWATTLLPFGAYEVTPKDTDDDRNAMALFFQRRKTFDLRTLRFGYCQAIAPGTPLPAGVQAAYDDHNDPSERDPYVCHMLIALHP